MKKTKQPKIDLDELTPQQLWQYKMDLNRAGVDQIRKLVYLFYEQYEPSEFKQRPELQLQIQLYNKEAIRLSEQAALYMQCWYTVPKD